MLILLQDSFLISYNVHGVIVYVLGSFYFL